MAVIISDDFVGIGTAFVNGRTADNGLGGTVSANWVEGGFLSRGNGADGLETQANGFADLKVTMAEGHGVYIAALVIGSGKKPYLVPRRSTGNQRAYARLEQGSVPKLQVGSVQFSLDAPVIAAGTYEVESWCEDGAVEGITVFLRIDGEEYSHFFTAVGNVAAGLLRLDSVQVPQTCGFFVGNLGGPVTIENFVVREVSSGGGGGGSVEARRNDDGYYYGLH